LPLWIIAVQLISIRRLYPGNKVAVVAQTSANDNKSAAAPETDVERFYKESVIASDLPDVTATTLYEDYCVWCEEQEKEPLELPTFGRELAELGVQKVKIAGRVRYNGIALRSKIDQSSSHQSHERSRGHMKKVGLQAATPPYQISVLSPSPHRTGGFFRNPPVPRPICRRWMPARLAANSPPRQHLDVTHAAST
jgi:hypothetical protein